MMRRILILAAAGLAVTAGTSALVAKSQSAVDRSARDQATLDKALAGKVAGKPQSCIPLIQIRDTTYIGSTTILYRVSSNLVYRNDPAGGCPGLRAGSGLITRTSTGQLCSGDIAQVRDFSANFSAGSCALGEFVPYRKAK